MVRYFLLFPFLSSFSIAFLDSILYMISARTTPSVQRERQQPFHFTFAFAAWGLGFGFYVFVVGCRHAFRSEWYLIID